MVQNLSTNLLRIPKARHPMFDISRPRKGIRQRLVGSRTSPFIVENFSKWRLGLSVVPEIENPHDIPAILSVGGGKGGVGKSIISANISALLGKLGFRVLVIDLDIGCSNLHTNFGVSQPKKTLADFILRDDCSFREVILPAPVQGVAFVAGGREEEWGERLDGPVDYLDKLWEAIFSARLDFNVDFVVLDLGAGTHRHTMEFFTGAHLGIVTVLPEPTSIENAYVFLKMYLRKQHPF